VKWLLPLLLCCWGCVQVPGDSVTPGPSVPSPEIADQFAGVDETLVQKVLEAQELRDPSKLRRYAALYKGMAETLVEQPDVPTLKFMQGGMKTTEQFIKPRSAAMQAILQAHMPPPPFRDSDRGLYGQRFASLSLACHAAAHRLEHPTK
jgi:hypothetical protein